MRKILRLLVVIVFCTPFISNAAVPEGSVPTADRIDLGIIVPLTGPLAFFGEGFVHAAELAQEAHPEIKNAVNLLWEDSAYDSKQAVSVFNKLTSIDHADIIWSFGGPMLHALAPLAESRKVPFFATESEKSDCEGKKYCSLFRNEEDEWGKATWKVLRKNGWKKIGIVKNQNQFMNTFVNAIERNKGEGESVEILIDVPPETVDLRTNVLTLKSTDVDAIGVYFLPGSHHGFLTAMRAMNKSVPFFGVEEFLVKENNREFGALTDGALVIAPGGSEDYHNKFEKRFGFSAGFYYTPAFYDFLVLLAEVISKKSDLRGKDLVDALHFSGQREGVSGKYSVKVSDKGVYSYSFPIFVYKVSKGSASVNEIVNF